MTGHSVPHSRTLRPAQEGLAEWARRVLVPPALRESSVAVWVVNTHLDHADAGRRAQQMERVLGVSGLGGEGCDGEDEWSGCRTDSNR